MTRGFPTDAETSARMKNIRRERTKPEEVVRLALKAAGLARFRSNVRSLPGSPDFASKVGSWAVLVHGCFWHGHAKCRLATVPTRNRDAWVLKIAGNRERDRRKERELRAAGYRVLVVWECETRDATKLERKIARFVASD